MSGRHTLTPWVWEPSGPVAEDYVKPFVIGQIATPNIVAVCCSDVDGGRAVARANAIFIAKAVNAHDKLVKALEEIARDRGGYMGEYHADCQKIAIAALASIKEPEE